MWSAFISQFDFVDLVQLVAEIACHTKIIAHTLPSAPCSFPQAAMTNASLTEMQATSWIPLPLKSSACCTKPGRWVWKKNKRNKKSTDAKIIVPKTWQVKWIVRTHLGTTRGESSWYSKENALLPLEELIHSHLISRLPLLDLHCWKMFTHLMGMEVII